MSEKNYSNFENILQQSDAAEAVQTGQAEALANQLGADVNGVQNETQTAVSEVLGEMPLSNLADRDRMTMDAVREELKAEFPLNELTSIQKQTASAALSQLPEAANNNAHYTAQEAPLNQAAA